tara:strand:+ start:303 stop:497 length:195 start_codon:yes stop_codon:yes gene_type:complete
MKITITSDNEYSERDFDYAFGKAKRFFNSEQMAKVYIHKSGNVAITLKRVNDEIQATIKSTGNE